MEFGKQNKTGVEELRQVVHHVRFASGIYFCISAVTTVIANALVLYNIQRQARKCFKSPTIYFIAGVCFTDLLNGILLEPLVGLCYFRNFKVCQDFSWTFEVLPPLLTNLSFFIVLLLSWVQYLAISHPYIYKQLVTKPRVITSEIFALTYSTTFSVLPYMGVPSKTVHIVDVIFHSTFVPFLLLISYLLILTAVHRHARSRQTMTFRSFNSQTEHLHATELKSRECRYGSDFSTDKTPKRKRKLIRRQTSVLRYVERQFVRVNLCLIVLLLVCTLPSIVVSYLTLNQKRATTEQELRLSVAMIIAKDFLFLKFTLDPFIFALSFRKLKDFSADWGYCCF